MLDYNDNPLDKIRRVDFRRPFLSISQRLAFRLGRSSVSGRDDIYSDDRRIAQSWFDGDAAAVGLSYRVGPYDKKLSVNLNYDYRHRRNLDRELLTGDPNEIIIAQNGFPIDSLYHRLGCGVSLARTEFITTKRIDGFSYTEDIVLGSSVGIAFQRAIHPDSLLYNSIKAGFDYRTRLGEGLMMFSTRGATDYRGSISYSRRSRTSLRYFYQPTDYMTLAARTVYINDWRFDGSEGLNLGGTSGIRGYDEYFRSGDRLAVTNLETRFYPDLEILSVLIGGAAFVDIGRTWKPDESFRVRDFHMAIGAGLRISFEKASKSSLVRLDVAYSDENRWQLSIGTGQYFGSGAQEMILTNF